MIFTDGCVYEGGFINDKFSGIGKITYKSGSWHEGSFKNGKKNGLGKYYDSKTRKITKGMLKNKELIKKLQ